ncbi:hypothetical protein ALTERO38_50067 [Alteromonas sp. 38]|nr:hypothetical protein ALTER154_90165 [Alteromonas sp. 154]VXB18722.1 hypothetical protein ALTERO38_50067 [Alteromonas sp. 38]
MNSMPTINISNGFRGDKVLGGYWDSVAPEQLDLLPLHASEGINTVKLKLDLRSHPHLMTISKTDKFICINNLVQSRQACHFSIS